MQKHETKGWLRSWGMEDKAKNLKAFLQSIVLICQFVVVITTE